ncbi:hypothetical protein I8S28_30345, partial [Pseudomonas aeruginosa]|uniref:hypothetical protein n=1 Tax=Pseudomonas aeruginosa TaxID=287 RepID=UPI0018DD91CF
MLNFLKKIVSPPSPAAQPVAAPHAEHGVRGGKSKAGEHFGGLQGETAAEQRGAQPEDVREEGR